MPEVLSRIDERWLPIKGYEELYLVSNFGRVMSRTTSRVLQIRYTKTGYARVNLSKDGQIKTYRIHRLVGEHFIPNPFNLMEINHINEIKADNRAENLEWCDRSYNVNFGTRIERQRKKVSKPVVQMSKDGSEIAQYDSTIQAKNRTGINNHRIADCCRGTRKSAGGYRWAYREGGSRE